MLHFHDCDSQYPTMKPPPNLAPFILATEIITGNRKRARKQASKQLVPAVANNVGRCIGFGTVGARGTTATISATAARPTPFC
jgi:hypothetical protein